MRKAIAEFLHTSYTCLFLVSPEIRKLEHAADDLRSVYAWPCLSLGRELGSVLLPVIPQRRPREAHRWMKTRLGELSPGPVLCTEIDLLFEPALELDPLRLLCDVGRVARLVVTWPGSHLHDVLAYAVPDHSHYRTWRNLFQLHRVDLVGVVIAEEVRYGRAKEHRMGSTIRGLSEATVSWPLDS
jgi:hypothetical protein